ncbi:unnamed protein product [Spodoptera littoralis]|uniref:Uncharacterized protein n=1 Tax=Spodoptera littoralis TaxID=7109 RepID=A0A9P0N4N5_SPOLI|nr:unnamed protein product [Spodoptera littoralis]CAH1642317.1 unnamed protein product [Spodoptera littoralis]
MKFIDKLLVFFGIMEAIDIPNNSAIESNFIVRYDKPYDFTYNAQNELNMTINFINCPPNVTELSYVFRSGVVLDTKKTIDLKKPSIHIQSRLMHLTATVSVDLKTLSGIYSFKVANGRDISTTRSRPWTRSSSKGCICCSPNWCILTVDLSKGFTNLIKKTYASVTKQKAKHRVQLLSTKANNTRRKTYASTTTRTVINFTKYTPVTTPAPITEDPSKNFYESPEAVLSLEHILLYYVLPASICLVLVSVVICLWLRIKKHRRWCSEALINTNNTGNEVLYADLELKGMNNIQRRCNEESPYAQIQISQ